MDTQTWLSKGQFFEWMGQQIFWVQSEGAESTKPVLLLIHGFPTSSRDWDRVWPSLAQQFQLHAIDMLGFGQSDKPADFSYSISASADQWQALAIDEHGRAAGHAARPGHAHARLAA